MRNPMSRITFPCQNPNQPKCTRIFDVSEELVGNAARCPLCGFRNTVPSAEAVALNNELFQMEAVLNECENKIKDGRLSVAVVKRRIQEIADPNEIMAWINAGDVKKIEAYKKATLKVSEIDSIDIKRLSELGYQHPNDSRVIQLGNRAADCHLKLSEINLSASEELGDPDSSVLLNGTKDLLSTMFPHWRPKSSVPPVISDPVVKPALKTQPHVHTPPLEQSFHSRFEDIFDAAKKGTVEDVKFFVEKKGVDVNARNNVHNTPMHHAAGWNSDADVMQYLVSQGGKVNVKNSAGNPPLYFAVSSNSAKVVKILVSNGAKVNERIHGTTLLHHAAESKKCKVEVLKYLISQGADVNAEDGYGHTPLEVACTKKIKRFLRKVDKLGGKTVAEIRSELLWRLIYMIAGGVIGGFIFSLPDLDQSGHTNYGMVFFGAYLGVGFGITKTVCQKVYGFLMESFGDPRVVIGIMVVGSILFGGIFIVALIAPIITIFRLLKLPRQLKLAMSLTNQYGL